MRDRLHVKVSRGCNNRCLFCLDDHARRDDVDAAEVARLLVAHRALGDVLFTCGEPTLHPELPRFVAMARAAGYRSVGLVTNGRRLAYPDYRSRLLDAGLDELTISIHGPDARTHDALTRSPGSFDQTAAALDALAASSRRGGVRVVTSTVLCRPNLDRLAATLGWLAERAPDTLVLNVVEPHGEARALYRALAVPYPAVARAIAASLEGYPLRERVVVEGLPHCFARPFLDRIGARERIHLREGRALKALPPDRNHVKPPDCAACAENPRCPGVFRGHVEHDPSLELAPFR